MIKMNMHRCDLKLMMTMVRVRQPLRQFTRVVIENVRERSDTFPSHATVEAHPFET